MKQRITLIALLTAFLFVFTPNADARSATETNWAKGHWDRWPAKVEKTARCISKHESWNAGLWTARNRHSTASGFAQWLDPIWRQQARRAHVGTQYARAYLAPPRIQAAVFAYQAQHYGIGPWSPQIFPCPSARIR